MSFYWIVAVALQIFSTLDDYEKLGGGGGGVTVSNMKMLSYLVSLLPAAFLGM